MNFVELYAKQLGYENYSVHPVSYLLAGSLPGVFTKTIEMGVNSAFIATELIVNAKSTANTDISDLKQLSIESREQTYNTNSFEVTAAVALISNIASGHKACVNGVFTGQSTAKLIFDTTVTAGVVASLNGFIITKQ